MIQPTEAIAQTLTSIIPPEAICRWENIETNLQKRIFPALAPGTTPSCIVYPQTQEELAEIIACAYRNRWRVLPCGSGSKISWGGLVQGADVIVSTERLNRLVEHAVDDLTITAEAGLKFGELQAIITKVGQFIGIDPAYPQDATLGGIVATADAGSWRHRYGGVRDMLLGLSFVRADGEIAKAGGRVVKNVAGYDLMKLFTGSYGTLGIISQVTFRLYPIPEASETVVLTGKAEAIEPATKTLLASALTPTAVDLLSTQLVKELEIGQGMALIARFQSVSEGVKEQAARLLEMGQTLGLSGSCYAGNEEANLWQRLQETMWQSAMKPGITCKIGLLPTAAVSTLNLLDTMASERGMGLIYAGSGLGVLRLTDEGAVEEVKKMRSHCNSHKGFLTVLEAPPSYKQQIDVWGYKGNTLDLMQRIKQQFDPKNIFNPHRFVGGI